MNRLRVRRPPDFSQSLTAAAIVGFVLLALGWGVLNLLNGFA